MEKRNLVKFGQGKARLETVTNWRQLISLVYTNYNQLYSALLLLKASASHACKIYLAIRSVIVVCLLLYCFNSLFIGSHQ